MQTVRIVGKDATAKLYVDGVEMKHVKSYSFEHEAGETPILKLEVHALDVEIDVPAIVETAIEPAEIVCSECGQMGHDVMREPLTCGCKSGAHPPIRNMLEGAAERDGRICALGWPVS